MDETRKLLSVDPADLFPRLVDIGRLMIFTTTGHVTHERIGVLEAVSGADGWARFSGKGHDSEIRLDAISAVAVDRSRRMGDKAYPRIELNDSAGNEIACIVGFDGLEPFDNALDGLPVAGELEKRTTAFNSMPEKKEVDPADPARAPFDRARESGTPVVVQIALPDFRQRWAGSVPDLKVSMGFINILEPDFHLHLRGGSIAAWREGEGGAQALDQQGAPLGFSVAARA